MRSSPPATITVVIKHKPKTKKEAKLFMQNIDMIKSIENTEAVVAKKRIKLPVRNPMCFGRSI